MKIVRNYAVDDKQPERDELARQMAEFEAENGPVVTADINVRTFRNQTPSTMAVSHRDRMAKARKGGLAKINTTENQG